MTITDILRTLARFRRVAILVAVLTLAFGTFAALSPPDRYRATTTIIVQPDEAGSEQVSVQVIDFLVPSFITRVNTRTFQERAARRVPAEMRDASVGITTLHTGGTGILTVEASGTDPTVVAPWANGIAEHLVDTVDNDFIDLAIIDEALEPSAPYAPARTTILVISVFLAVLLALLATVVAATIRGRGDHASEVRERFGAAVLGEIPRLRGSLSNLTPAELMVHPGAANVIDALQTLRANLTFALIEKQYPWFVVTSADPNEGKSFVSTSLAWMLASVNRSTILVDGDSRRPTGHRRLGRAMGAGLGDVGPDNLREVLETTSNPYLRFLGAGDPDRHPAEIASTHLPHLLNQVETTGEVVIIDSPPLPLAAETIVYVSGLGSALLVIDARRRDLTNVERVVTTLSDRGVSILGVVINRSRRKISGGKYYAKGGTSRPQRTRQPEPSAAWTQPMSPTMTATRSSERPADTPDVLTVRDAASSSPFATSWPDKQPLTADDDPAH